MKLKEELNAQKLELDKVKQRMTQEKLLAKKSISFKRATAETCYQHLVEAHKKLGTAMPSADAIKRGIMPGV